MKKEKYISFFNYNYILYSKHEFYLLINFFISKLVEISIKTSKVKMEKYQKQIITAYKKM